MGWELTLLSVDHTGGRARPFQFEIVFTGEQSQPASLLRGDGILLDGQRVRFNRQADMVQSFQGLGLGSEDLLNQLASKVVDRAERRPVAQV